MKYYSIAEMSKNLNMSAQTLRNWDENGKLKPHNTTDSGYRYYSQEQLNKILGIKEKPKKSLVIVEYLQINKKMIKDLLADDSVKEG